MYTEQLNHGYRKHGKPLTRIQKIKPPQMGYAQCNVSGLLHLSFGSSSSNKEEAAVVSRGLPLSREAKSKVIVVVNGVTRGLKIYAKPSGQAVDMSVNVSSATRAAPGAAY